MIRVVAKTDPLNSERLVTNLIQAVLPQAGFLRRVHESLRRRFLGPWKDHRQRAKNRNRRLFRVDQRYEVSRFQHASISSRVFATGTLVA